MQREPQMRETLAARSAYRTVASCLLALVLLAWPTTARGSAPTTPPLCPNSSDILRTFTPPFVREGQPSAVFSVERTNGQPIQDATLTVNDAAQPFDIPPEEPTVQIIRPINVRELEGQVLTATFRWTQNLGTPAACRGLDTRDIPIIADDQSAGDPYVGRLEGRYRTTLRPLGAGRRRGVQTWSFAPTCEVFACSGRLRAPSPLVGRVTLQDNDLYRFTRSNSGTTGLCRVRNLITGEVTTIKPAYRRSSRVSLRVAERAFGIAIVLKGKLTFEYITTSRADNAGCGGDEASEEYALTLTRIRRPGL